MTEPLVYICGGLVLLGASFYLLVQREQGGKVLQRYYAAQRRPEPASHWWDRPLLQPSNSTAVAMALALAFIAGAMGIGAIVRGLMLGA